MTLVRSLRPGDDSTPEATSTIQGRDRSNSAGDIFGCQPAGDDQALEPRDLSQNVLGHDGRGSARLPRHEGIDEHSVWQSAYRLALIQVAAHLNDVGCASDTEGANDPEPVENS